MAYQYQLLLACLSCRRCLPDSPSRAAAVVVGWSPAVKDPAGRRPAPPLRSCGVGLGCLNPEHYQPGETPKWAGPGFTFSFLKKNSVTTGNGIPAEISRFSGNFDRKEFSNSKFRNFGIPAGFSVHLAGFSVLFTEK